MELLTHPIVLNGIVFGGALATFLMVWTAFASWWERKFSARMQNRVGPVIVGPAGVLQPIADAFKLMQKEDVVPRAADRALFNMAPPLPLFLVLSMAAVIPFAGHWEGEQWVTSLVVADLDVGVLWVLALAGLVIFPNWMAGYASANKYTLLSAMRGVAQGVSYEIPLVMAMLVPVVAAGDLSLGGIVEYQAHNGWLLWRIPGAGALAFAIFFLASLAEANRIPFDIPEAESELVAGVLVEYTGIKMGIFVLAEYLHTLIACILASVLFLGGPLLWPITSVTPVYVADAIGLLVLIAKAGTLFVFIYWVRWSWYRFRADQLMTLCWNWLVPITLVLVMFTAVLVSVGLV
jgi:NADH-quinone oxidoreductase subunit H